MKDVVRASSMEVINAVTFGGLLGMGEVVLRLQLNFVFSAPSNNINAAMAASQQLNSNQSTADNVVGASSADHATFNDDLKEIVLSHMDFRINQYQ